MGRLRLVLGLQRGSDDEGSAAKEVDHEAGLHVPAGHHPDGAVVREVAVVGDVPNGVSEPSGGHDVVPHGRVQEQGGEG